MVEYKHNIKLVDADTLIPTIGNPNHVPQAIFQDIMNDIKSNGFYGAILINKDNEIVDGEHRWRALKALGMKKVPVILDENLNTNTSRIQTIRLNRERGYLTPIETGKMLLDLTTDIPMDILSTQTAIPRAELDLLTSLEYDPDLEKTVTTAQKTSWSNIDTLVSSLVGKLKLIDKTWDTIYTKSRGGLIPARLVADKLDIQKIIVDKKAKKGSLIIDDIYDSGKTYKELTEGLDDITFGTLFARHGEELPDNVQYGGITEGTEYVVFPWDKQEYSKALKSKANG